MMWIIGILLIVLISVLLYRLTVNGNMVRADESPLEILRKRYASGEISRKEFEQRKRNLKNQG